MLDVEPGQIAVIARGRLLFLPKPFVNHTTLCVLHGFGNLDRFELKMMDRVWSIDATWDLWAMSQFGNITSISESPLQEGLIYAGTDDGLIQVTEDQTVCFGEGTFKFISEVSLDVDGVTLRGAGKFGTQPTPAPVKSHS